MSDRNLLITILDTNPIFWGLQSNGLVKQGSNSASRLPLDVIYSFPRLSLTHFIPFSYFSSIFSHSKGFTFEDCLSAVVGFVNVYKTMNQNNAVVLIAAHNTKA